MAECKECQVNYNREAMVKIKMKKIIPFLLWSKTVCSFNS